MRESTKETSSMKFGKKSSKSTVVFKVKPYAATPAVNGRKIVCYHFTRQLHVYQSLPNVHDCVNAMSNKEFRPIPGTDLRILSNNFFF